MSGYIGVNGVARKIKKVYVGVDGVAREVKSGYTGVGGVAKKWWSGIEWIQPGTTNQVPSKGSIVLLNLDGTERQYRVLKSGNPCKVMGMWDDLTSKYNSKDVATTMGSTSVQKYEGSTLDTYLNTTWYSTLKDSVKTAIVPENVVHDAWYWSSGSASGNPVYSGTYGESVPGTDVYSIGKYTGGTFNIGERNVFALGMQDVIDYLNDPSVQADTTAILRNINIWKMFWNDETSHSDKFLWLRSSAADDSRYVCDVLGTGGRLGNGPISASFVVRPALNLDFSKIAFALIEGKLVTPPSATSSYTVTEKVSGASYGFALNSSGYYESNNKGVNNSAAVCRVNLNLAAKSNITFTCINYAESNYDFGLLGNVDSALGTTNTVDSSVAKSFKGSSQSGTQTYTYSNVAAGEHFIDVKFRKDSSASSNNDSLQFKITIANA